VASANGPQPLSGAAKASRAAPASPVHSRRASTCHSVRSKHLQEYLKPRLAAPKSQAAECPPLRADRSGERPGTGRDAAAAAPETPLQPLLSAYWDRQGGGGRNAAGESVCLGAMDAKGQLQYAASGSCAGTRGDMDGRPCSVPAYQTHRRDFAAAEQLGVRPQTSVGPSPQLDANIGPWAAAAGELAPRSGANATTSSAMVALVATCCTRPAYHAGDCDGMPGVSGARGATGAPATVASHAGSETAGNTSAAVAQGSSVCDGMAAEEQAAGSDRRDGLCNEWAMLNCAAVAANASIMRQISRLGVRRHGIR
jgi:hypothetical protein